MTSLPPRWALTPPFHPYRSEIPDYAATRLSACRPCPDAFTGGCFLLRSHDLTAIKSLACVVLCVARTFLPRPVAGSDRADLRCKGRDFSQKSRIPETGFRFSKGGACPTESSFAAFGMVFRLLNPLIFNCPFFKGSSSPTGNPCRADSGTEDRNAREPAIRNAGA